MFIQRLPTYVGSEIWGDGGEKEFEDVKSINLILLMSFHKGRVIVGRPRMVSK